MSNCELKLSNYPGIVELLKSDELPITTEHTIAVDGEQVIYFITDESGNLKPEETICAVCLDMSDEDVQRIKGFIVLTLVVEKAHVHESYEFVEAIVKTVGEAFAHGSLKLVESLTEDVLTSTDEEILAYHKEHVMRWTTHGVVCMTDVLVADSVMLTEPRIKRIPRVYDMVICGEYLVFNQPICSDHIAPEVGMDADPDRGQPLVCGGTIYKSTSGRPITIVDGNPTIEFNGDLYTLTVIGPQLIVTE